MKKIVLIIILLVIVFGMLLLHQSPVLRNKIISVLPQNIAKKLDDLSSGVISKKTKPLYKWKNKKGKWIVSDTPPDDETKYETLQYNPDTNVMPAKSITGKASKK